MAERAGFEPAIPLPVYTLSRRAPSTARPPLRRGATLRRRRGVIKRIRHVKRQNVEVRGASEKPDCRVRLRPGPRGRAFASAPARPSITRAPREARDDNRIADL